MLPQILPDNRRVEGELLLACAGSALPSHRKYRIRQLLDLPLDWNYLIAKIRWHGLLPLFYWNLRASGSEFVPPEIWFRLEAYFHANTTRCLLLAGELLKILDLFHDQGLKACPFKGPLLAAEYYGHIGLRSFGDLDILVPQQDIPRAIELLISIGYSQAAALDQTEFAEERSSDPETIGYFQPHFYTLTRQATKQPWGNVRVDLQWRISDTHFAFKLDSDTRWSQLDQARLLNHQVPSFPLDDLFLILSVHGCKHYWYRIKWICDIAEILRASPNHDWRSCLITARSLGVERMIRLSVFLANRLLDAPIPDELSKPIKEDRGMRAKAHWICGRLFADDDGRISSKQAFFFYLSMRDHLTDRIKQCWLYIVQLLAALVLPTEKEYSAVPLPGHRLHFLYHVIRPMRLGVKYSVSALRKVYSNFRPSRAT